MTLVFRPESYKRSAFGLFKQKIVDIGEDIPGSGGRYYRFLLRHWAKVGNVKQNTLPSPYCLSTLILPFWVPGRLFNVVGGKPWSNSLKTNDNTTFADSKFE